MVYSTLKDHWGSHYSGILENQLDVAHLPHFHHKTMGRGNRTLVNGPITSEESHWPGDHLIKLWVNNELDEGQKPKKPSEMPKPIRFPPLPFCYGNLWQNRISDGVRTVPTWALEKS